jgi:23S rRNA pseudouridine2605 synthase
LNDESNGSERKLVRLNKYLADNGIASRRRADQLIATGEVMVDGQIVTELGTKVDPATQRVEWDGVVLKATGEQHRYYLLNKPTGVVCTNDEKELRRRAWDLIGDDQKGRVYPVGRLDVDTSGLIILTNDGEFTHRVTHPSFGIEKTYRVVIDGMVTDEALEKIRRGLHLAEGRTATAKAAVKRRNDHQTEVVLTLTEGKNREVRRVFSRFGYKVRDLHRMKIGPIGDRGIPVGQWRMLEPEEVEKLLASGVEHERPKRRFKSRGPAAGRAGERRPGASSTRAPGATRPSRSAADGGGADGGSPQGPQGRSEASLQRGAAGRRGDPRAPAAQRPRGPDRGASRRPGRRGDPLLPRRLAPRERGRGRDEPLPRAHDVQGLCGLRQG